MKRSYFDLTFKPIRNKDGEVYAIIDMAVDVTAQVTASQELKKSEERYKQLADELEIRVKQRTTELNETNQELIHSNSNLKQFAYAASHDLQEPLRKIQSFGSRLQTLCASQLDENGIFMLSRMQDAAKRMSYMIDDLLTYSRLSNTEESFAQVDLNKILREAAFALEIGIQEQCIELEISPLPFVHGHPSQLVQLFQNLISNAIKYRFPERPTLIQIKEEKMEPEEIQTLPKILKNSSYTKIIVKDNGIGFDEKYLDRIFQMFQRLHGKGKYEGSGIGLALCQKVVQNHQGYLTAQSIPGEGSTFIVYLPLS